MKLFNEGRIYHLLIDPFLDRVHSIAASAIQPGQKVMDVACGNGTLALKMAFKARHVNGIDLSEDSLEFARKRATKLGLNIANFRKQDANDLSNYQDKAFDVATISMAIHQFSPETGLHIINQLKRIADSIIIIDYAFPQPADYKGILVRFIERIAGLEHFTHFNAYLQGGGIEKILGEAGLKTGEVTPSGSGVFVVLKVRVSE